MSYTYIQLFFCFSFLMPRSKNSQWPLDLCALLLQAIKDGQYSALSKAVLSLKAPDVFNEFQYPRALLDVCDEVEDCKSQAVYPMTLLAYAGYHFTTDKFDILEFLIKQEAREYNSLYTKDARKLMFLYRRCWHGNTRIWYPTSSNVSLCLPWAV